jgi:acyl-CoA reductase-like NAD-dependent aldehyde dehydrogenase
MLIGGFKDNGLVRERGREGIEAYMEGRSTVVNQPSPI